VNPDQDPIWIQYFDDQKLKIKKTAEEKICFSIKNCYLLIPTPPLKTSKLQGEAFCPQKRTSKNEIY
jgi:hypothetical protein